MKITINGKDVENTLPVKVTEGRSQTEQPKRCRQIPTLGPVTQYAPEHIPGPGDVEISSDAWELLRRKATLADRVHALRLERNEIQGELDRLKETVEQLERRVARL